MPNPLIGKIFDEFPDESDWDVVVIGAGPNGLIASAYLAKAGLKVATVERRYEIGGGLALMAIPYNLMHILIEDGMVEPGKWWYPSPWYIPQQDKISAIPR